MNVDASYSRNVCEEGKRATFAGKCHDKESNCFVHGPDFRDVVNMSDSSNHRSSWVYEAANESERKRHPKSLRTADIWARVGNESYSIKPGLGFKLSATNRSERCGTSSSRFRIDFRRSAILVFVMAVFMASSAVASALPSNSSSETTQPPSPLTKLSKIVVGPGWSYFAPGAVIGPWTLLLTWDVIKHKPRRVATTVLLALFEMLLIWAGLAILIVTAVGYHAAGEYSDISGILVAIAAALYPMLRSASGLGKLIWFLRMRKAASRRAKRFEDLMEDWAISVRHGNCNWWFDHFESNSTMKRGILLHQGVLDNDIRSTYGIRWGTLWSGFVSWRTAGETTWEREIRASHINAFIVQHGHIRRSFAYQQEIHEWRHLNRTSEMGGQGIRWFEADADTDDDRRSLNDTIEKIMGREDLPVKRSAISDSLLRVRRLCYAYWRRKPQSKEDDVESPLVDTPPAPIDNVQDIVKVYELFGYSEGAYCEKETSSYNTRKLGETTEHCRVGCLWAAGEPTPARETRAFFINGLRNWLGNCTPIQASLRVSNTFYLRGPVSEFLTSPYWIAVERALLKENKDEGRLVAHFVVALFIGRWDDLMDNHFTLIDKIERTHDWGKRERWDLHSREEKWLLQQVHCTVELGVAVVKTAPWRWTPMGETLWYQTDWPGVKWRDAGVEDSANSESGQDIS